MEWGALVVPIFLSLLALIIYKHKLVWFEVILPIIVSLITISIMKAIMISGLANDTEYLTEYVTQVQHNEKWNERVSCRHPKYCTRTETYTYKCGKSTCTGVRTVTYQCGWKHPYDVDTHPEHWLKLTNCKHSYQIKKDEYDQFVVMFGNQHFKDMKRKYHTVDGNRYYSDWNDDISTVRSMSWSQIYKNKTQASRTIFKFKDLDTIAQKGLYQYPEISKNREQDACLGCNKDDNLLLRQYNGLWGKKHEIKVFILILDGNIEIAERQRQHWKNGNKNELVICVAKDGSWVRTFSWADDKSIEVNTTHLFNQKIPISNKIKYLDKEIKTHWKRKHFSDFDYIRVPLKNSQMIWIYIISTILSIIALIIGIKNDITQDNF